MSPQTQVVVSKAAVEDYGTTPYILLVRGQYLGDYVPLAFWGEQLLEATDFTAPDATGFQTFRVALPAPTPPGSYQLLVKRTLKSGKPDHST